MVESGFDIIIPYHGQYKAMRDLIGSIFLQTRHVPFQITVIDDASPNKDFFSRIAQMDKQVDGVYLPEQKGFGAALNEAIAVTKRPWLVFLNSDCIVQDLDWLIELYKVLEQGMSDKIGLVSATTNHGGSNKLIERERQKRVGQVIISTEPLPLICAMCPRKLFDRVGLFKEYPYGWYEDEEFYWRMRSKGYKQAIAEKSWVFHHGGLTTKALWEADPNIKTIMVEDNRKKCLADIKEIFNK